MTSINFSRSSIAWVNAAALSALAIIDAVITGVNYGPEYIIYDPGKFFFGIVIFPAAIFILIKFWPKREWTALKGRRLRSYLVITLSALLLVLASASGWYQSKRGDFESWNEYVAQPDKVDIRTVELPWPNILSESVFENCKFPDMGSGFKGFLDWVRKLRPGTQEAQQQDSEPQESAIKTYKDELVKCLNKKKLTWNDMSFHAKLSAILNAIYAIYAVLIPFYGLIIGFSGLQPQRKTIECMTVTLSLISIWVVLRMYSEWWGNFGEFSIARYPPLPMVAALIALAAIMLLALAARTKITIIATAISISSTVVSYIVSQWSVFQPILRSLATIDPIGAVLLYVMLLATISVYIVVLLRAPE